MSQPAVNKKPLIDWMGEQTGFPIGHKQILSILMAAVLFFIVLYIPLPGDLKPAGQSALAILVACIVLWMTEAIPTMATSMLMLVLSVFMKVMNFRNMMAEFGNSTFLLVLALIVVAMGMSHTNLAARVTYKFITTLGISPSKLLLAIVATTTILSAFIADIPVVAMMMPIGVGILSAMGEKPGSSNFGRALMIGIPWASLSGGLALISGSGINYIGISILESVTKGQMTITYLQWAAFGIPFALLMIVPIWLILLWCFKADKISNPELLPTREYFVNKLHEMGPINGAEKRFITIVAGMLALFLTGDLHKLPIPWVAFLAMAVSICPGIGTVNWEEAKNKLPWDVLFLIGATTSFATAVSATGLGGWIVNGLLGWAIGYNAITLIFITAVVGVVIHLIIIGNNAAPTAILTAAVVALATQAGINPAILVIPAVFTGSATTLMPLEATVLITAGTGYWKFSDYYLPGILVSIAWCVIFTIVAAVVGPVIGML